jgi:hypothetical protein
VRKLVAVVGLLALGVTSAQGQKSWQSEIGVQGGYARIKPAGTGANDQIDVFGVPGNNYVYGLLSYSSLFAVIPWKGKMAIEPSFLMTQLQAGTSGLTTARVGARLDYALTPKVYAAAGGEAMYLEQGGSHQTALAVQAAVGYRIHVSGTLNGRVEAHASFSKKTDNIPPIDVYGVLFGLSSRVGGASAPARRAGPGQAWAKMIGVQGGYTRVHSVGNGGGDVTAFSAPGFGSSAPTLMMPPTLFAIFPIGQKAAIEPGLNIDRIQASGATQFAANMSGRVNYAVSGNWYGAAGVNFLYIKATPGTFGKESGSVLGANVAWGYRYHVGGNVGGRVELGYSMFGRNKDLPVNPQNITAILVGLTMALK